MLKETFHMINIFLFQRLGLFLIMRFMNVLNLYIHVDVEL